MLSLKATRINGLSRKDSHSLIHYSNRWKTHITIHLFFLARVSYLKWLKINYSKEEKDYNNFYKKLLSEMISWTRKLLRHFYNLIKMHHRSWLILLSLLLSMLLMGRVRELEILYILNNKKCFTLLQVIWILFPN